MYLSVLWWALAEASVEPRAKPSVFIYDARTLFSLGRSGALQTRHDLHQYALETTDRASLMMFAGQDPDHGDAFIAAEARRVLEIRWRDVVDIAPTPEEADAILWLVWDYGLCPNGAASTSVERDKKRLKASCSSHIDLLQRVMATERWQRNGGRDHAFMVLQPHLWAQVATLRVLVDSASTLVVIEERRPPEARGNSRAVVIPYYAKPSGGLWARGNSSDVLMAYYAKRSLCSDVPRQHFISYVDSLTCVRTHDNADLSSTAIRATVRSSLAQCATCVARDILSVLGAGGRHRLGHHVLTADAVESVFELLDELGTTVFPLCLDFRP